MSEAHSLMALINDYKQALDGSEEQRRARKALEEFKGSAQSPAEALAAVQLAMVLAEKSLSAEDLDDVKPGMDIVVQYLKSRIQ